MRRLVGHATSLVLGVAVCVASIGLHRDQAAGFPAGLVFVGIVSLYVAWVLRLFAAHGRFAASYCLGWVGVLGYVLLGRPEGDFVIASDVDGYGLIVVGLLMLVTLVSALAAREPAST